MRKIIIIVTATAATAFAATSASYAQTSRGAVSLPAAARNFTPIEQAGCRAPGPHCGVGHHWQCALDAWGRRHCFCRPC